MLELRQHDRLAVRASAPGCEQMFKRWLLLAIVGMLLLGPAGQTQEGYKIIVNSANPITSLTKAQVSKFFLEKSTWDDGQPVSPVDLVSTSSVREIFSREILAMSPAASLARWQESNSGRGEPPLSVASDREVLAFIRLKPGAIGYVSAAADIERVKVVSVVARAVERTSSAGQRAIAVGGAVPSPEKIFDVPPIYPGVARTARLQGVVDVEIVVGTTGSVEQARVMHSVHGLDDAALTAIKQWKYRPTVINGVAVPVLMMVHVSFKL
jgi:TonB family protein